MKSCVDSKLAVRVNLNIFGPIYFTISVSLFFKIVYVFNTYDPGLYFGLGNI